ncbi:MAG: M20/M25/M40 family metallo-hydrolase, partial [Desulfosarcina sp.]
MISSQWISKVLENVSPDAVINLATRLVQCNSVWDPQAGTNESKTAAVAARWARDQGFDVTEEVVAPGRPNVIVRWKGGPGPRTLMFEGHTDVVTPGDPARWRYDPFGAHIENGRMFGR